MMQDKCAQIGEPREVYINILGYLEDGEWIALALEMDLRGHGATFDEALNNLLELVCMQISFALHKGQPSMVFKDAEPKYFRLLDKVRQQSLMHYASTNQDHEEDEFEVRGWPLPPVELIAAQNNHFISSND